MSRPTTQFSLKENLVWIVGLAVCVILLIVSSLGYIGSDSESASTKSGKKKKVLDTVGIEDKYVKKLLEPPKAPKTLEVETQEYIEEYQTKADDISTPEEDKPEYLFAIGNLTRDRLKDSEKAKEYFERIVLEFPNHVKSSLAHRMLYECYMDLGDQENARWVCNEMLKKFSPESADYVWAQIHLGLANDPEMSQSSLPEQ